MLPRVDSIVAVVCGALYIVDIMKAKIVIPVGEHHCRRNPFLSTGVGDYTII